MKKIKRLLNRVDVQVSLLLAFFVLISSLSIFLLCYQITCKDTIKSLGDRVESIYGYIDPLITKEVFTDIQTKEDMKKESYIRFKNMLEQIKYATGVMYLYTATINADGNFIYQVDGLDYDAPDFRYPGDLIEPEIQDSMRRAMNGETIMPDEITETDWGNIFITYLPMHEGKEVIGVIGVEFEADHQYQTYRLLRILMPIICGVLCVFSVFVSYYIFRRISNPKFLDWANTDAPTGLKNRNSFDLDLSNINAQKSYQHMGLIVFDLNHLKQINDTFGHDRGDYYIRTAADALREYEEPNMILYRTGGDEFVVMARDTNKDQLSTYIQNVQKYMKNKKISTIIATNVSAGAALYDPASDSDLSMVYKRADQIMYKNKRAYYESK